jgi:hypothetical protein
LPARVPLQHLHHSGATALCGGHGGGKLGQEEVRQDEDASTAARGTEGNRVEAVEKVFASVRR